MTENSRLHPGASIGGKYRLEAPLARGGMGAVWRAQHVELGVPVAIKFMDAAFASSGPAQGRFAREAKAAAGLRHPNIVDVRDYGVDGDLPYLVMELLTGEDLGERLKRVRRLSTAYTAVILAQMARALRRAHEAGIVHRDLKPGNVFLARVDDEEVVKILDFGIAKDTSATAIVGDSTRTGELMGSPHYMSPEQIRGAKDLDGRSDLWALGVIVFRCLTGRLPFHGDAMGLVIAQILADPIPLASSVAPDLPPEIDAFLARALVRDRAARFATARDMAAALTALGGAGQDGGSRPQTPGADTSHAGLSRASLADSGQISRPITGSGPVAAPITGSGPVAQPITDSGRVSRPITGSGPLSGSGRTPLPVTFGSVPPETAADHAPPEPRLPSGPLPMPPVPMPAAPAGAASAGAASVFPPARSGGNRAAIVAVGVAILAAGLCVAFFSSGPGAPAPSVSVAGAAGPAPAAPSGEPLPAPATVAPAQPPALGPTTGAAPAPASAAATETATAPEHAHSAAPRAHPPAEAARAPAAKKPALPPISF